MIKGIDNCCQLAVLPSNLMEFVTPISRASNRFGTRAVKTVGHEPWTETLIVGGNWPWWKA